LKLAADNNVRILDTAAAYGESEAVLGRCLPSGADFDIVTKTLPLKGARGTVAATRIVSDGFNASLKRLKVPKVHGLLVHHAEDLLGPGGNGIWEWLLEAKSSGQVERIGISVYDGAQIDLALDRYNFDLIQLPLNVLDQRLVAGGQLTRLKQRGVKIHARSVFLQGLLLMEPGQMPDYFAPVVPHLVRWRSELEARELTPAQGALAFLQALDAVDVVLTGVESISHLEQNINDISSVNAFDIDFTSFALDDDRFLNPSNWRLAR
jgi:aryl-alcohol dehydrogenase-like predicted oxidoreductase